MLLYLELHFIYFCDSKKCSRDFQHKEWPKIVLLQAEKNVFELSSGNVKNNVFVLDDSHHPCVQCDQIGRFLKVFVSKFTNKILVTFCANLKNLTLM